MIVENYESSLSVHVEWMTDDNASMRECNVSKLSVHD